MSTWTEVSAGTTYLGDSDVVEPPDRDVFRHQDPAVAEPAQRPDRHAVIGSEDRGRTVRQPQQGEGRGVPGFLGEIPLDLEVRHGRQPGITQRDVIPAPPLRGVEIPGGPVDQRDPAMSQPHEVPHHRVGPLSTFGHRQAVAIGSPDGGQLSRTTGNPPGRVRCESSPVNSGDMSTRPSTRPRMERSAASRRGPSCRALETRQW